LSEFSLTANTTGKQWHEPKKAFRPGSGLTPYEKRAKERVSMALVKAKEKEMKDEKEAERKVRLLSPCDTLALQRSD
jgi:rRNA-processing protein CGR1